MKRTITYVIDRAFSGKSVEQYLRGEKGFSSGLLRRLKLQPDGLLRNGGHIRTVDILETGDCLTIHIPDDNSPILPADLPVRIAYEDEDVIVLNKPPFMPVHPTRNHQGDTLANALAGALIRREQTAAFRAVNRLDRDTSGLVVAGLNTYAACRLTGHVDKTYYAVVHGELHGTGTICLPIYRPDPLLIRRAVGLTGEHAVTHWHAVAGTKELTLLRIRLETGRTHQIRVHFSHLGYPLAGDTMYGEADGLLNRQALHCKTVSFTSPVSEKAVTVDSEFPQDMQAVIEGLSAYES